MDPFYRRDGRDFNADLAAGIERVAASGVEGFEPLITSPADIGALAPLLKRHGLEMRSLYVNSALHDAAKVSRSMEEILAIADAARKAGTRTIVTNPSPIRWGGPGDKDDSQLQIQAKALDALGARLKGMDLTLAYHNHDAELRQAAREFHHMMVATDPANVTLCLDAHWIYRGSGNSAVALFDIAALYGSRVTELHLRQSAGGVWTEALGEGDIDYPGLAQHFLRIGAKPHIVIEQAVEQGTPATMDAVTAHRKSYEYAQVVFAGFAGPKDQGACAGPPRSAR